MRGRKRCDSPDFRQMAPDFRHRTIAFIDTWNAGLADSEYLAIWRYVVAEGRVAEFERRYGPDGDWVRLFRRSPAYLGTELWRDRAIAMRYLTLDRWRSESDWLAFRRAYSADYEALDRSCAILTEADEQLGAFVTMHP